MPAVEIINLPKQLRARAVETLVLSFQDDVIKRTLVPDAQNRAALTRWVFEGVVRYCTLYGEVQVTPNADGVACWIAPGKPANSTWGMLRSWGLLPLSFLLSGKKVMSDFMRLQDYVGEQHERLMHAPHWYLWALAVRPGCQGQGLGGSLLAPMLERADRDGLPCYLETQTEQNESYYARRGFVTAHRAEILGMTLRFMIRERAGGGKQMGS